MPRKRNAPAPAPQIPELERRVFTLERCEVRESTDGGPAIFSGYAAVFNQLSVDLGGFRERIIPGCFQEAIDNGADVRLLINHDPNLILGRTVAGTLSLREDATGLWVEAPLPDTSYARDLQVSMKRGDVTQMSFGFRKKEDAWKQVDEETGLPIRDLVSADLFDTSPVTFPAYPQTTAEVRALAAQHIAMRKAVPLQDFPLADRDHEWDADAADQRVRDKLDADDAPNPDYAKVHFYYDENAADDDGDGVPDAFGDYKLPYCDVIDGEIRAVPRAIFAVAGVLSGGRGGVDIPEGDASKIKDNVEAWYARMAKEFEDDTLVAPWNEENFVPAGLILTEEQQRALEELPPGLLNDKLRALMTKRDLREGKVLSTKNQEIVSSALSAVTDAGNALQTLLDLVEPNGDEQNSARPDVVRFLKTVEERAARGEWDYDDDWEVYVLTSMISLASSFMVYAENEQKLEGMRVIMLALNGMLTGSISDEAEQNALDLDLRSRRLRLLELA